MESPLAEVVGEDFSEDMLSEQNGELWGDNSKTSHTEEQKDTGLGQENLGLLNIWGTQDRLCGQNVLNKRKQ